MCPQEQRRIILSADSEPTRRRKRLIIAGVLGAASLFALVWSSLAIFIAVAIWRGDVDGSTGLVMGVILPAVFLGGGVYGLVRFVPSLLAYLVREWSGRYEVCRAEDGFYVSSCLGREVFVWGRVAAVQVHENLIGCFALSILRKNGSGWTFGNLYSENVLRELRKELLEWKRNRGGDGRLHYDSPS